MARFGGRRERLVIGYRHIVRSFAAVRPDLLKYSALVTGAVAGFLTHNQTPSLSDCARRIIGVATKTADRIYRIINLDVKY